jgi:hypothetical protein
MSTIDEVRACEKKLKEAFEQLADAEPDNEEQLTSNVRNASEQYAAAVRELGVGLHTGFPINTSDNLAFQKTGEL